MIKSKIMPLFCLILVLISGYLPLVNAVVETDLGSGAWVGATTGYPSRPYMDPKTSSTKLSNGRIVFVTMDTAGSSQYFIIEIHCVNALTGDFIASRTYQSSTVGYSSNNHSISGLTVASYTDDEALIFFFDYASQQHGHTLCLKYNSLTNTNTVYEEDATQYGTFGKQGIGAFIYENNYYFICFGGDDVSTAQLRVQKFDGSELTVYDTETLANSDESGQWFAGGYQDPSNKDKIYIVTCDNLVPVYGVYDIDGKTYADLAVHPNQTDINYGYTSNKFLNVGIDTFENGLNVLYYNWFTSYAYTLTYMKASIYQHRLIFNGTINASNLEQQHTVKHTVYNMEETNLGGDVPFANGYFTSKDSAILYFVKEFESNTYAKIEMKMADWEDVTEAGEYLNGVPYGIETACDFELPLGLDINDLYYKNPYQDYALWFDSSSHHYIITGLEADATDVSMSLTVSPNHTPRQTLIQYTFTLTALNQGNPFIGSISFKADSGAWITKSTDGSGKAIFSYTGYTTGLHTFYYRALTSNDIVFEDDVSYTFVAGTVIDPDTGQEDGLPVVLGLFSQIIAPAVILLVPTFLFFQITGGSAIGSLGGLTLGALMGIVANTFPVYVLIIVIIIDVMVIMMPNNGGS